MRLNAPRTLAEQAAKENEALHGNGVERMCSLTSAQQRSFMAMRAVTGSPLMIGSDLPTMGEEAWSLLTNRDIIFCNQNTKHFSPVPVEGVTAWRSDAGYLAVFNRSGQAQSLMLNSLKAGTEARNVWSGETVSLEETAEIPAGDVLFLRLQQGESM